METLAREGARRSKAKEDLFAHTLLGITMTTLLAQIAGPIMRAPPTENITDFVELGGIGALILGGAVYGAYKSGQYLYYTLRRSFEGCEAEKNMLNFLRREYPDGQFLVDNQYDKF